MSRLGDELGEPWPICCGEWQIHKPVASNQGKRIGPNDIKPMAKPDDLEFDKMHVFEEIIADIKAEQEGLYNG